MTKGRRCRSFFVAGLGDATFKAVFSFAFMLGLLYNNISYTFVHGIHERGEEKVKDFLDTIRDFCGDNYIWILVGAAALLLMIVAAVTGATVRNSHRRDAGLSDRDERDYFLEGEYDLLLKSMAAAKPEEPEATAFDEENEAGNEDNPGVLDVPIESQELQENSQGNGQETEHENRDINISEENGKYEEYKPEKELESLADHPVCININIEHGHIRIGYGPDGEMNCSVAEGDMPSGENERKAQEPDRQEDGRGQEIVLEKINLIKGAPVRKFGPDNLNTGRSGRIYTEEELCRLIKE